MKLCFIVLTCISAAFAQPTIVVGTLAGPGGDKLNGSCDFAATATFLAADGFQVAAGILTTAPFSAGALRVALEPTDTGIPAGVTYQVNCAAPSQIVTGADGKKHASQGSWGPWTYTVPTSATPVNLAAVLSADQPPPDGLIPVARINPAGATNRQVLCYNGTAVVWGDCGGSGLGYYPATVSGASTTILATTHGLGIHVWLDACATSGGAGFEPGAWTVDPGTGDVTITGTSAMAGVCKLMGSPAGAGIYTATITGSSATIPATQHGLIAPVVAACTDAAGKAYVFGPWSRDSFGTVTILGTTAGACILE